MRAAIYCRLSKLSRGETISTGLDRQERDCRRIVGERGWHVAAVFRDVASASPQAKRARKQWLELEGSIQAGDFDAVVFWLEDRSNRSVVDAARFVEVCREAHVKVVISGSDKEYDFTDPEDVTNFFGEAAQAQREVARIQKRIRRQQLELAENGQDHGGGKRAFGFTGSGAQKVPLARALAEQEMIHEAASRVIAGDSLRGICLDWNRRGVASTQGSLWTTSTLRRLLKSPRVAGLREHNSKLYDAAWSPIVPREQWEAVKAILEDPARRTNNRGGVHRYLLTGLLFCGPCRNRLTGVRKDEYIGYMCRNKHGEGKKCVQRSAAPVDELITEAVFTAVESPQWHEQIDAEIDDPTRELYESLARDQARLDGLSVKEDEALELEIDGKTDEAKRLSATIERLRARYEREMDSTRRELSRLGDTRVVANVPTNLRSLWPDFSLDRKRAILAAVIERIEIDRTGPGRRAFDPNAVRVTWKA